MATPDIMAQLQAMLLAQVQGQTAAQTSTRSELEKLLANPGTPIEAMPATGLSPEALAALRGRAIDAVPGRYDAAQRNLTASLSSRGLLTGQNAAAGDTSRLFGMLASEREKTRAGSLRDVTLTNEDAYNKSLDRNEAMRSAREKERLTQLQQLIQGYGTSLQSSDPNGALGLLNQQGISAADNVSRETIANAELKVRMATSDSERAARQAELDSLNARAAAQLASNNTNSAADRALEQRKLAMAEETHRLDIIKQQQALSGQVPGQSPQTNAPGGTVNNLVTGNVPLANLTAQQQADKLTASLYGGGQVWNYGILGPVKPLPSIQNFGSSGLGTVVPPVDPNKVPGKAAGGPVSGGKYIVGERGPEVLAMEPGSEGYVYPNSLFKQLMGGGGMPGRAGGGPVGFQEGTYDFGHLGGDSQVSGDELAQYLDSPHYAPEPDRAGAQAFLARNQPSVGESLANSLTKNPERSQALQMLLDRVLPKGKGQEVADQNIEVPYKTVGDHEAEQRQAFEQLKQRMAQAEIQNKLMQYAPKPDTSIQPFDIWRQQNPTAPIRDWFNLQASTKPTPGPQPSYDETQIRADLTGRLGREPTPGEFLAEKQKLTASGVNRDQKQETVEKYAQRIADGDFMGVAQLGGMGAPELKAQIMDRAAELYEKKNGSLPPLWASSMSGKLNTINDYFDTSKPKSTANQIKSFGAFLEHSGDLKDAIDSIKLTNSGALNKPLEWWRKNMEGTPEYGALVAALEPVRNEASTFLAGGYMPFEKDKASMRDLLSDTAPVLNLLASSKQLVKASNDRMNEINFTFKRATKSAKYPNGVDVPDAFSPEALTALGKFGVRPAGGAGGVTQGGGSGKTATMGQITSYATKHGMSVEASRKKAESEGFRVE